MRLFSTAEVRKTLDDDARPVWLDMATLRFEKRDSYLTGWEHGLLLGAAAGLVVITLLTYGGWFRG